MNKEKNHDDLINEEIEQEHAERRREKNIEVIQMPEEDCQKMEKNLSDPNLFAMDTSITIHAVNFVDMNEFNSQKFSPLEIDKQRKQYIQDQLKEKIYATADFVKDQLKERGFTPINIICDAEPFEQNKYAAKAALIEALKDLERDFGA